MEREKNAQTSEDKKNHMQLVGAFCLVPYIIILPIVFICCVRNLFPSVAGDIRLSISNWLWTLGLLISIGTFGIVYRNIRDDIVRIMKEKEEEDKNV